MQITGAGTSRQRARRHVSAKLDEVELLVESFRAASLQCVQTTAGQLGASVRAVSTRRTEVREVAFGAGAVISLGDSFSRFAVGIGLRGDIRTLNGRLTGSNIAYINGRNGMVARLAPGSRWCNISFDHDLIHCAADTHGYSLPTAEDTFLGLPVPKHNALGAVLSRVAGNELWSDACDVELEDELALTVLRLFNPGTRGARARRGCRQRLVRQVIEIIRAEFTQTITVTSLCQRVGAGERTLQYAFKSVTGLSVQQYLMAHRLQAARALLLRGDCERVSDAACACGIHHPGRFAQYYRRLYGESPRRSLPGFAER